MNCAGGERGNGLILFATRLLVCSGNAFGGGGAERNAGWINGKCGGTGFKMGDGRAGAFLCACGALGASGALESAFKVGERGGLTKINGPGMLDLQGNWWSNCKPSNCVVAWKSCRAVFRAFSWVDIPKFLGGNGGVYWGCCCSCMMFFNMSIFGYIGSTICFLRLMDREVDVGLSWTICIEIRLFSGWVEEERGKIAWLDWAMEPERCCLGSFATSAKFPAGDVLAHSWTSFFLLTKLLSV